MIGVRPDGQKELLAVEYGYRESAESWKTVLRESQAARRSDCEAARVRFAAEYQAKYPKALESLTANWERPVSFFEFPAEHWKHLRTTNMIESAFATVRLREGVTKGAGSRTKGLLMAIKQLDMAQQRWRRLDGAALLPLVRAGVKFVDGVQKQALN